MRAELAAASAEQALLREEIGVLHALVAELQEALRKNSSNSSRPPSTDAKKRGRSSAKKPSGKKRGAQLGHPKHERALLPVDDVDRVVPLVPATCDGCGGPLVGRDPSPRRRQVIELPPIRPHVTEYQLHALECAACRARTCAPLPAEARFGVGPGVDAMVGALTGVCRLSKRTTAEVLGDAFGVPLSVGGVIGCQKRVREALAAPAEEAKAFAKRQRRKHSDETPWRQGELKGYLWTLVTPLVVVFTIAARRSSEVAKSVLGPVLGILHTDRYAGYGWWATSARQVCWAHLVRDVRAIAERGADSARVGEALLAEMDRMFGWWERVKAGELSRRSFQVYMRGLRARVEGLLEEGTRCAHKKTARTCQKLLAIRAALWTFVTHEGVEPTNNAAEQALRFAVLWRKMSYGTHSMHGSRFVERLLTTYMTLRRQKRSSIGFLREACCAHRAGRSPPSLLPS